MTNRWMVGCKFDDRVS